jgi:hypothetical protein
LGAIALIAGGVGLAAVGTAGVLDAASAREEVRSQRLGAEADCSTFGEDSTCRHNRDVVADNDALVRSRRTWSWATVGVGGALAATGVLVLLFSNDQEEGAAALACGATFGGATCRLTF